jgi:hypothetical protein
MASTLPDSRRELLLGIGAAAGSLILGLVLVGIAVTDRIGLLSEIAVVAVLLACVFAYGIGGLYDIVARGIPQRGLAHLVTGAGIVLALLAPYGTPDRLFVATAALALLLGAGYHAAIGVDLLSATEEPAAELEDDSEPG